MQVRDGSEEGNVGPLSGVVVLEVGSLVAGPTATRLLADLGAEVIKVEAPDKPDPVRDWGQSDHRYQGRPLWWPIIARNKKCITIDLRLRKGQRAFLDLVRQSDVVVENLRPGTLERWHLGWTELSQANPSLILARVSGYGQTGPYADRAGYASAAEAMGGLRYINGFPGMPPPRAGISLGDTLAGMFCVIGVLSALHWRDQSDGEGQVVDVSLVESCFAMLEGIVPEYDRLGLVRHPSGTRLDGIAPSNTFETRDKKWVVIAANNDNVFRRLCEAMGQPDLAADPRFLNHFERGEQQEEIEGIVAAWAHQHDAADLLAGLSSHGVVCSLIYSVADIFSDPYFVEREMLVTHHDLEIGDLIGPGIVPKFSKTPGSVRWSGVWKPGHHNEEVFKGILKMSDDEIEALLSDSGE